MPRYRIAVTMTVVVEADSAETAKSTAVSNTRDELLLRRFRVEVGTPRESQVPVSERRPYGR